MVQQVVDNVVKQVRLVRAEKPVVDLVHSLLELSIGLVVLAGIVAEIASGLCVCVCVCVCTCMRACACVWTQLILVGQKCDIR